MITLVALIVTGIAAAIFATQNTQLTSVQIAQYSFSDVPVYLIVLGAVLLGILVSFIINFINSLAASIAMHGKDGTLKSVKREVDELNKEIHKLELENTRLKTELGQAGDENSL